MLSQTLLALLAGYAKDWGLPEERPGNGVETWKKTVARCTFLDFPKIGEEP